MPIVYPIAPSFPTATQKYKIAPSHVPHNSSGPQDRFEARLPISTTVLPSPLLTLANSTPAIIAQVAKAQFSKILSEYPAEIEDQIERLEILLRKKFTPEELLLMWTFDADHGSKLTWRSTDIRTLLQQNRPEIVQILRALRSGEIQGLALRPLGPDEGDFHIYKYDPSTHALDVTLIDLKTIADKSALNKGSKEWTAPAQARLVRTEAIRKGTLGHEVELNPRARIREYRAEMGAACLSGSDCLNLIPEKDLDEKNFIIHIVAVLNEDADLPKAAIHAFLQHVPDNHGRFFLVGTHNAMHSVETFANVKRTAISAPQGAYGLWEDFDEPSDFR